MKDINFELFYPILTNKIILSVALAIIISQLFKILFRLFKERTLDITKLWDTGGMPSSHSALASSLALAVFLTEGITTISIVTFFLCTIVIRDAFGLRREAGEQAKVLNRIVQDLKLEKKLNIHKLKELVGHNFFQVVMGIFAGVIITLGVFSIDLERVYPFTEYLTHLCLSSLYFVLPGLVGNMMPIFVKNHFKFLAKSVDFGIKWKGKRLFGEHKTFRGFIFGIFGGFTIGFIQFLLYDNVFFNNISYIDYSNLNYALFVGALFGFAALFGDLVESFFKRRIGVKPGKPFIPFDQVDSVLGIILFALLVKPLGWDMIIVLLLTGPLLSVITTKIGYALKIRQEKW